METSYLIAKIAAVAFLAIGLSGILRNGYYGHLMKDIYKNSGLVLLYGFLSLIVGMLIVHYHNFWVADWIVLVTIIGWISLLKGISLMLFPDTLKRISTPMLVGKFSKVVPYSTIVLGLIFGYFGFFS